MKNDSPLDTDDSAENSNPEWQELDLSDNGAWKTAVQVTHQRFLHSLKPENIGMVNGVELLEKADQKQTILKAKRIFIFSLNTSVNLISPSKYSNFNPHKSV